jgi:D-psicose/D-tagatose/L-ribulose 3-epimerase
MEWLIELLKEAGEYAAERNVTFAIEPLNRYETNVANTVNEAIELARRVASPAVRVLCDTYHMNIEETSIRDAIVDAAGMLAHVHVSDNNRAIPGRAHINFDEVFSALRTIGYDGYVTLEPILGREISRDLAEAKNYLEKFLR